MTMQEYREKQRERKAERLTREYNATLRKLLNAESWPLYTAYNNMILQTAPAKLAKLEKQINNCGYELVHELC